MGIYRCTECGAIYNEAVAGTPLKDLPSCPSCGNTIDKMEPIDLDLKETDKKDAAPEEKADKKKHCHHAGHKPRRLMTEIDQMASTGESIHVAMEPTLSDPSWDDIEILAAGLDPRPLAKDATVDSHVIIGKKARKPLTLNHPFLISGFGSQGLPKGLGKALATGAAITETAIMSGDEPVDPEVKKIAGQYIYEYMEDSDVDDAFLQSCDAIVIKIGQAAKAGTEPFAALTDRDAVKKLVYDLRDRSEGRPIGLKIAAGHVEDDIFVCMYAEVDFVILEGRGAADDDAPYFVRESLGMPTIYAIGRAVKRLKAYLNENTALIVAGGLRVSSDIVKALALGADAVALGSSAIIAASPETYRYLQGKNRPACGNAPEKVTIDEGTAAGRLGRFLRVTSDEIRDFCRLTGHANIDDLSMDDLATTSRDIAEYTDIKHV